MKRMIWFVVLVAVLGVCAGAWAGRSPVGMAIHAGVAIVVGGNLLFMTWLWRRARPGSGDALFLPGLILVQVAMLVGFVPRLIWPAHEGLQTGASVVSCVFMIAVVVWTRRRNRRLLAARLIG